MQARVGVGPQTATLLSVVSRRSARAERALCNQSSSVVEHDRGRGRSRVPSRPALVDRFEEPSRRPQLRLVVTGPSHRARSGAAQLLYENSRRYLGRSPRLVYTVEEYRAVSTTIFRPAIRRDDRRRNSQSTEQAATNVFPAFFVSTGQSKSEPRRSSASQVIRGRRRCRTGRVEAPRLAFRFSRAPTLRLQIYPIHRRAFRELLRPLSVHRRTS